MTGVTCPRVLAVLLWQHPSYVSGAVPRSNIILTPHFTDWETGKPQLDPEIAINGGSSANSGNCDTRYADHLTSPISIATCVLLLVLKISLTAVLKKGELFECMKKKVKPMMLGMTCQFFIMPACGALVVRLVSLPFVYGMALIVVTTCPGGSFSNVFCQLFNGDLAMSIAMTFLSTCAGMVMLPMNVFLYGTLLYSSTGFDQCHWHLALHAIAEVLVTLIAGISIGLMLGRYVDHGKWSNIFQFVIYFAGFGIFLMMAFVSSGHKVPTNPIWNKPPEVYMAVFCPPLLAGTLVVSICLGGGFKLQPPERVAIIFEVIYQNCALGGVLTMLMFAYQDATEATGLVFLYQLVQCILLAAFGTGAHYLGWTLANPKEVSLIWALWRNFQRPIRTGSHDMER